MPLIGTLSAIIFDIGHVLYEWDPRHLYAKLIDDPERLDWFLQNVVTREWHFQHDAGRAFADTSRELIARFPVERALIEAYGPRWLETVPGPVTGSLELVRELAARGMPLYAITNFSAEFWTMFRPTAPVFDLFRDIVVSGQEGVVKPAPEIFRRAIARFAVEPATTLFIDDRAENVAAARHAGLRGWHFTGAAALGAALFK